MHSVSYTERRHFQTRSRPFSTLGRDFASILRLQETAHQTLYWNTQFFGIPQSRDRVYIVFWLHGLPAPDLEHRPAAFCDGCEREIQAVRSWKTLLKWGRYREQYVYVCPWCACEIAPFFTPVRSFLTLDEPGDFVDYGTTDKTGLGFLIMEWTGYEIDPLFLSILGDADFIEDYTAYGREG